MELLTPLASSTPSASAGAAAHHGPAESKSQRQVIAETLQQLRAQTQQQREHEAQVRQEQDEFTKSIVKIMHLDTNDYDKIIAHTRACASFRYLHGVYELTIASCLYVSRECNAAERNRSHPRPHESARSRLPVREEGASVDQ